MEWTNITTHFVSTHYEMMLSCRKRYRSFTVSSCCCYNPVLSDITGALSDVLNWRRETERGRAEAERRGVDWDKAGRHRVILHCTVLYPAVLYCTVLSCYPAHQHQRLWLLCCIWYTVFFSEATLFTLWKTNGHQDNNGNQKRAAIFGILGQKLLDTIVQICHWSWADLGE